MSQDQPVSTGSSSALATNSAEPGSPSAILPAGLRASLLADQTASSLRGLAPVLFALYPWCPAH